MKTRCAILMLLVSLLALDACKTNEKKLAVELPNIVYIMADDLGYNDLGCYGQEKILTPNIDLLADQGMRFTDFYAGAAVCAPSRACLQTGLHTGHVTVRGNQCRAGGLRKAPQSEGPPASMRVGIPEREETLGDLLQKADYTTGIFGKWHLSGYLYENTPFYRGYDEYMGSSLADPLSTRGGQMFHNDTVVPIPEVYKGMPGDERWTHMAIDFMKRNREKPFYLMLNLSTPHKPFRIDDQGIYADSSWNDMTKNYAALVSRLDTHVGLIMKALDDLELADNTLLIFCSDNGGEYREYPEEWAEWAATFKSNHPLKGGKADFYEGGIRVPFIARWPAEIKEKSLCSEPLYFPDIMPTFAELAALDKPAVTDGISFLDILKGDKNKLDDRYMYWEFEHRGFHQAVRYGDWVLLRYLHYQQRVYGQEGPDDRRRSEKYPMYELYNLKKDISQEHNLIEEHPEVAQEILNYLKSARTDNPYYPLTAWEQESLDSLNETVFQ